MRFVKSFIIICIFASLVYSQGAIDTLRSEIRLRTYIEKENVPLNREVVYHIELRWPGDLSKYKISEILEPTVTNLATRGSGSSNKVRTEPDGSMISIKQITFYFRPMEIGMAYIDGVTIRYQDTHTQRNESLISSRIGVKIEEPLPEPSQNNTLSGILGFVLLLAVVLIAVYFYMRYRKKQHEAREKELSEIKETVEEKYLRLLKDTIHFNTDNVKDGMSDLTHLMNGYLSEKYHLPVSNLSDEDLFEVLNEKELPEESRSRIKDFYLKANLVKFAGEAVEDAEFHRLYDTVELVLENQKSIKVEEDK